MGQILVKVRDKSVDDDGDPTLNTGVETVITYNAYKLTSDKFELLCQVQAVLDKNGNPKLDEKGSAIYQEVPGNPNLNAQHQRAAQLKNVVPVVNVGPSDREKELMAEIERLKAQNTNKPVESAPLPPIQERKKPGPKPKLQEQGV